MRPRDVDRLASTPFDILVIGGGIHGLATAYEAASRGLRAALVEAEDFGSGASAAHQTTAYGRFDLRPVGRVRGIRSVMRERRTLARIAPWLLRPLPFLAGTYRSAARGRLALRAAFKAEQWLTRARNERVEPELHLPATRLVSKAATVRLFPGIHQERLTGGAQWYDYQVLDSDRLTLAFAAAADRAGAVLANHVEALSATRDGARISGVRVRDLLTRQEITVQTKTVVNAAGARAGDVMASLGVTRPFPLVAVVNLVTSKPAADMALVAPAPDGQVLAIVPWRGRAIVGSWHAAASPGATPRELPAAEVEAFIAQAARAFPRLALTGADVARIDRSLVAADEGGRRPRQAAAILDHGADGAEGAFTLVAVRHTGARDVAARAVTAVARKLQQRVPASRTAETVLPGAGIADHEALAIETARGLRFEVELPLIRHLIARYAEAAAGIVRLMVEREEWRAPLAAGTPTVGAEVIHAVRDEMAVRLTDVVRRTGLGGVQTPSVEAVEACARLAAGQLGWDAERERQEMARLSSTVAGRWSKVAGR
jgi:glycerol-3-phosphate dehydrogenase